MSDIVIPRNRAVSVGKLVLSVLTLGCGVLVLTDRSPADPTLLAIGIAFTALGGLGTAASLRELVTHPPTLRATAEGMWFGGGRLIRWSEVDAIFAGQFKARTIAGTHTGQSVSITFRSKRTRLALPMSRWFAAMWSLGDVDVSPHRGTCSSLVAELEAMRTLALGHEDGVIAGTNPIPAARVVKS